MPIPVTARSKAYVLGHSLTGIVGSNPVGSMDVLCECCDLSVRGRCIGRSPAECGVSDCDRDTSNKRRPCPNRGCCAMKNSKVHHLSWETSSRSKKKKSEHFNGTCRFVMVFTRVLDQSNSFHILHPFSFKANFSTKLLPTIRL